MDFQSSVERVDIIHAVDSFYQDCVEIEDELDDKVIDIEEDFDFKDDQSPGINELEDLMNEQSEEDITSEMYDRCMQKLNDPQNVYDVKEVSLG